MNSGGASSQFYQNFKIEQIRVKKTTAKGGDGGMQDMLNSNKNGKQNPLS